jgi:ATP-dependent Zn protease
MLDDIDDYVAKTKRLEVARRSRTCLPPKLDARNSNLALVQSPRTFLAYCALVHGIRRNVLSLCQHSFLTVFYVPDNWPLEEVFTAARIVLKAEKGISIRIHPKRQLRRSWEFEPSEFLDSPKIILLVSEGAGIHEDFLLAATAIDTLILSDIRHLQALGKLMKCGPISSELAALIAKQPSEKIEAIYRLGQPAMRAAMKLAETAKKAVPKENSQIDISTGFGEASDWAVNLKQDIEEWRRGKLAWSEVDRGILLYGPPGTGKTRFAAALASMCGFHLVASSVSKWQSNRDGALGDMLNAMYKSFAEAKNNAPSLIFIDEVDSVGDRARFPARHANYSTQVVNGLLEAIDGVEGRAGVIVMGACNFPEKIDPAILRSGRLEKHVHFPLPDAEGRAQILAHYVPTLKSEPGLKEVAAHLPGYSGADLERLARRARRKARTADRDLLLSDLTDSLDKPKIMDAQTKFRIAIHEGGHALVATALDLGEVYKVEIFDNQRSRATEIEAHGLTSTKRREQQLETDDRFLAIIAMDLAGIAAEEPIYGNRSTAASGSKESDLADATRFAIRMITDFGMGRSLSYLPKSVDLTDAGSLWENESLRAEVDALLTTQLARAKEILRENKDRLIALATALSEATILTGSPLKELLTGLAEPTIQIRKDGRLPAL